MKKTDNIEKIFRKEFEDYRIAPSRNLWNRILKKMRWKEFLHFSPSQFNVYYLAMILIVATGIFIGEKSRQTEKKVLSKKEKTIAVKPGSLQHETKRENNVIKPIFRERKLSKREKPVEGNNKILQTNTAGKVNIPEKSRGQYSEEKNVKVKRSLNNTDSIAKNEQKKTVVSQRKAPASEKLKPENTGMSEGKTVTGGEPVVRFTLSPKQGCPPLHVKLINQSRNCDNFSWIINNKNHLIKTGNAGYTFKEPGIYIIMLTGKNKNGRQAEWKDTVKVFQPPVAKFEIYPKDAVVPENEIIFYNYSENASKYLWSFGDNTHSTVPEPSHRYTTDGPFTIVLKAWSAQGCVDSMVMKDAFGNSLYYIRFPNAFIPNPNGPSDGYFTNVPGANEVFHPVWNGVSEYHLQIFNRFGALVFESNDLHRGWDGYIRDELAKPGVYIWKAKGTFANGKPFVRFGNVTLVRRKN